MGGVFLSLEPEALNLLKGDDFDHLELSRLLKTLSNVSSNAKNGQRLENVAWRKLNKSLVANRVDERSPEVKKERGDSYDRKSIFYFNSLSSPDSTSHSPADNHLSLKNDDYDLEKSTKNIAVTLLKRNNTNASLFKPHHYQNNSTNTSVTSLGPNGHQQNNHNNTKSLFHSNNRPSSQSQLHKLQYPSSTSTLVTNSTAHTVQSAKKIESTTSLFAKPNPSKEKDVPQTTVEFDSSDDEDSEWMDSDWSSISGTDEDDDENDDDENNHNNDDGIKFPKKVDDTVPQLKRSLLSGMFLDKFNDHESKAKIKGNTNPKLVLSPSSSSSKPLNGDKSISPLLESMPSKSSNGGKSISPLLEAISPKLASDVAHGLPAALNEQNRLHHQQQHQQPVHALRALHNTTSSQLGQPPVNKSAISLTSFYASNRRPTASNAPPTATTLLPTALATHIFLPTKNNKAAYQNNHNSFYSHQNQHSHHHNHYYHQHHPQHNKQQQQQQHSNNNTNNGLELTHANLAQLADIYPSTKDNNPSTDVAESVCSVKTSTSSIDIPGKQSRLRRERELEKIREKERQEQLRQRPPDPNRDGELELLEKELPLNLVDSLHNENKLFGMAKPSQHKLDMAEEIESTGNVITEGILGGNKGISAIESLNQTKKVPQNYVDDHLVDVLKGLSSYDEHNDNYYAKGW